MQFPSLDHIQPLVCSSPPWIYASPTVIATDDQCSGMQVLLIFSAYLMLPPLSASCSPYVPHAPAPSLTFLMLPPHTSCPPPKAWIGTIMTAFMAAYAMSSPLASWLFAGLGRVEVG